MAKNHATALGVDVYPEDAASCADGQYFRTNVMAYALARLQQRAVARGIGLPPHGSADASPSSSSSSSLRVLCVDPSVAQCMQQFDDVSAGPVDEFRHATHLLIPLSNYLAATRVNTTGHWSLLVVEFDGAGSSQPRGEEASNRRRLAHVFHIDSYGSTNLQIALSYHAFLKKGWHSVAPDVSWGPLEPIATAPQQPNTWDCGPFAVCAAADIIDHLDRTRVGVSAALYANALPASPKNGAVAGLFAYGDEDAAQTRKELQRQLHDLLGPHEAS
uniref:Ubiquitin-like protease family profile domain-containing protein n=1 Tax=Neobodo designis TaxID=312471 RepID=A0A7S1M445_NEODS|mmetsp:Transcript_33738/g.104167  ORF Transcript_33738/g.104167 Transcript_33738/m.104167 type:complete len:274 (+) Transcript_33738:56-877(+)